MNRPSIKLQNSDRSHNRYLTERERDELLQKPPQVIRVSKLRAKNQTYRLLPPVVPLRDMNEASAPSITRSDMDAYVGIGSKGNVRRVRAKVREFIPRFRVLPMETIPDEEIVFTAPRES